MDARGKNLIYGIVNCAYFSLFNYSLYLIVFFINSKSAYRNANYAIHLNANEEMLAGNADPDASYPDADIDPI